MSNNNMICINETGRGARGIGGPNGVKLAVPTQAQIQEASQNDSLVDLNKMYGDASLRASFQKVDSAAVIPKCLRSEAGKNIKAVSMHIGSRPLLSSTELHALRMTSFASLKLAGDAAGAAAPKRLFVPFSAKAGVFAIALKEEVPTACKVLDIFARDVVARCAAYDAGYGTNNSRFIIQTYARGYSCAASKVTRNTPVTQAVHGTFPSPCAREEGIWILKTHTETFKFY